MAVALNPTAQSRPRSPHWLWPIALVGGGLALVVANVWHDRLFHAGASTDAADAAPAVAANSASATTVVLSEGKFQTAAIACGPATRVPLATEVSVSGQVIANPDRLIDIHASVVGVTRMVRGEVGGRVKKGDVLVVIDSADVGKGRLDLRARQRDLVTARAEADWKREVAKNVEEMIPLLRKNVPAKDISAQFVGKLLGSFRATLLSGYADYEIARHEEEEADRSLQEGDRRRASLLSCDPHAGGEAGEVRGRARASPVRRDPAAQARRPGGQERRGPPSSTPPKGSACAA